MQVQKLFNATEAAEFLGLHKPQLYEWINSGKLQPVMQTGRIKLYALKDLKKIKATL